MKTFPFVIVPICTATIFALGAHAVVAAERHRDSMAVIAEGAGLSPDEALDDALRNAVRQVVGVYVDAETLIQNDRLVSDKVLTYSDGFVSSYRVLEENRYGRLYRRKIVAVVERSPLLKRLKESKLHIREFDGRGFVAETLTRREARQNAAALLQRTLKGFPANVLQAEVLGRPDVTNDSDSGAQLVYRVRISVDRKRYEIFRQRLIAVLDQIATHKGSLSTTSIYVPTRYHEYGNEFFSDQFLGTSHRIRRGTAPATFTRFRSVRKSSMNGIAKHWQEQRRSDRTPLLFVVHTGGVGVGRFTRWRWFEVPVSVKLPRGPLRAEMNYEGASGDLIRHNSFQIGPRMPGISIDGEYNRDRSPQKVIISPYLLFHRGTGYRAKVVTYARYMVVERIARFQYDDLSEVQAVRCRVTTRNR